MAILILGLLLFLGAHSVRIVGESWRTRMRAKLGDAGWKGAYSVVSIIGFALIIWGYGMARQAPVVLWVPPVATRHIAALLTLFAFIFLVAAYVPRNGIKAKLHHPMILGVKVWALAHLLANGNLADVVLFGSFLAWAILDFRTARHRDRHTGVTYPAGTVSGTITATVVGIVAWAVFAFWLHLLLIGVPPMPVPR